MHRTAPRPVPRVLATLGVLAAVIIGGCGEGPGEGVPSRGSTSPSTGTPGESRSTLGRARDRAESVIDDVHEYDRKRMDLIDEMNGVQRDPDPADDPDDGG
jgi:hypothetical protein